MISYFSSSKVSDPRYNLSSNQIQVVMEDHEGYIWIGTNKGVNRYNPLTGRFKHYTTGDDPSKSLSNDYVNAILEGSDGNLWIGTRSGLNKFSWQDTSFTYYTKRNNMPDDNIYDIIEDKNGDIWASTDRGIVRLDMETGQIRAYDKDDGLQGIEFNNGASYLSYDGEIFFGGTEGFNSFYPDSMSDNEIIPPVVLTKFESTNAEGTTVINLS
ncbi:MAG: histidine kinase, partial [Bacteroidetes bacterium]|nr:histidine kinase [Bacteroidota bacterium]